ncbi:hypothetical protein SAMN05444354_12871 [Stigmatella aurantiaca]|uniref:Lipoprotein n=1 Tax=Stigmatella aurantiaca TaxID=41 RepID=A0A1H8D473_STIAU|nr:hypothetical protein [Stigmatella aurantiaca]SEN01962.1 hypothetical protein SAMN05444354_12871 [Stigmatella aurantiaca]
MAFKTLMQCVVLAAGLLSLGCGGATEEEAAENLQQTEQSAVSCPAGYSGFVEWTCERGCTWTVNVGHLICTSNTAPYDSFDAGITARSCGECF